MIDRYHLRYFLAVVNAGNFSRAAHAMNVAQPTLSVGIAKLEAALGGALFHRTNRHVHLTEAGDRLLTSAKRIESEFNGVEAELAARPQKALLRLGILSTLSTSLIEQVIAADRSARGAPDQIELVEGREHDLLARLELERLDAALTIIRAGADRFATEPLFKQAYLLALPDTHRLAARKTIDAADLAGETMIIRRHCEALPQISRHFTARGIRPHLSLKTTNDDLALAMVRAGLGITVMPDGPVVPGIRRPKLSGLAISREIGLVFPRSSAPATRLAGLLDTIRSVLKARL